MFKVESIYGNIVYINVNCIAFIDYDVENKLIQIYVNDRCITCSSEKYKDSLLRFMSDKYGGFTK